MILKIGALALGVAGVLYLSWLPDPNIGLKLYFPRWLGEWTNANGNLRTAVPFVFLGSVTEFWFYKTTKSSKRRLIIILISLTVVVVAETGQLLLPRRHFDVRDIAWGCVGAVGGIYTVAIVNSLLRWKLTF